MQNSVRRAIANGQTATLLPDSLLEAYAERTGRAAPRPRPEPGNTSKRSSGNKAAMVRLPADFEVTDEMQRWAVATVPGVDLGYETEQFIHHHRSRTTLSASWPDEWMMWVRRAYQRATKSAGANGARIHINGDSGPVINDVNDVNGVNGVNGVHLGGLSTGDQRLIEGELLKQQLRAERAMQEGA
ncbi:hypothetical protein [Nonomuraea salmonea]|uniref:hypothetical protein n=1 Tax=Nonomuraea salmonea TaxID=46181 RepID=UPI002FEDDD0B